MPALTMSEMVWGSTLPPLPVRAAVWALPRGLLGPEVATDQAIPDIFGGWDEPRDVRAVRSSDADGSGLARGAHEDALAHGSEDERGGEERQPERYEPDTELAIDAKGGEDEQDDR